MTPTVLLLYSSHPRAIGTHSTISTEEANSQKRGRLLVSVAAIFVNSASCTAT
jgi:hypothetical protein